MRVLLSSEALPGALPDDLMQACRRRALAGLELSADEAAGDPARFAGTPVAWVRLGAEAPDATVFEAARALGAGLLLRVPTENIPDGVPVALVHGSDPDEARRAAAWAAETGGRTAWEVAPGALDASAASATLRLTWPALAHVRLLGAGPENEGNEGLGSLMTRLALDGYAGTLALAPSPEADLEAWSAWLFHTRGWGCGSAAQKRGLTTDVRILE